MLTNLLRMSVWKHLQPAEIKEAPVNEATELCLQKRRLGISFDRSVDYGAAEEQLFGDVGRLTASLLKSPGGLGTRKRRRLLAKAGR